MNKPFLKSFIRDKRKVFSLTLEVLVFVLISYFFGIVTKANYKEAWEFETSDMFHEFQQANDVRAGLNPYKRILSGDLLINKKYATLFPLYYYFLTFVGSFSNYNFEIFIDHIRTVLFWSALLGSAFLYIFFRQKNMKVLGFLAVVLFLFNRWSINTLSDSKQDFIAIAFLIVSLHFFNSKQKLAYLFYGLSLGIKHLGIFVFPLFLTPFIYKEQKPKKFFLSLLFLFLPVLIPALPFLLNDYKAFLFSMLFSFTRKPATTSIPFGYENLLILYNIGVKNNKVIYYLIPRIPLLFSMLLNIYLLFTKRIPVYFYPVVSLFLFISFNPVLFDQYLTWVTPLLLMGVVEVSAVKKEKVHGKI
ncbi:MAG: hypothetical protein AAB443_00940 [Patescibacteria group bacterium]